MIMENWRELGPAKLTGKAIANVSHVWSVRGDWFTNNHMILRHGLPAGEKWKEELRFTSNMIDMDIFKKLPKVGLRTDVELKPIAWHVAVGFPSEGGQHRVFIQEKYVRHILHLYGLSIEATPIPIMCNEGVVFYRPQDKGKIKMKNVMAIVMGVHDGK